MTRVICLCSCNKARSQTEICLVLVVFGNSRECDRVRYGAVQCIPLVIPLIFRLRNPRVWFDFLEILLIWVPQLRSSDIVTPRYLAAVVLSSSVLWRKYLNGMGVFNLVTCRTRHFAGDWSSYPKIFPIVRAGKGHLAGCLRLTMSLLPNTCRVLGKQPVPVPGGH